MLISEQVDLCEILPCTLLLLMVAILLIIMLIFNVMLMLIDDNDDDGDDDDDDDDIYIYYDEVCVCLSRKIITSHIRADRRRCEVSRLLGLVSRRPALA